MLNTKKILFFIIILFALYGIFALTKDIFNSESEKEPFLIASNSNFNTNTNDIFEEFDSFFKQSHERMKNMRKKFFDDDFFNTPVDDLFNDDFLKFNHIIESPTNLNTPEVDIEKIDDELIISITQPDIKNENFNFKIEKNSITIESNQQNIKEENNGNSYYSSSSKRIYKRTYQLPEHIITEKVQTEISDDRIIIKAPIDKNVNYKTTQKRTIKI